MGRKRKYATSADYKEAKKTRNKARYDSTVHLGDQRERWSRLAQAHGCTQDSEFAKLLLDKIDPLPRTGALGVQTSMVEGDADETMSYAYSTVGEAVSCCQEASRQGAATDAVTCTEEDHLVDDGSVECFNASEYVPTEHSILAYNKAQRCNERYYNLDNLEEVLPGDLVHPLPPTTPDDAVDMGAIRVVPDPGQALEEIPCIAYLSCLKELSPQVYCTLCKPSKEAALQVKHIGSAIVFIWVCENNHTVRRWSSQPRLKKEGFNLGDFMLGTNILLSGNNYSKIALLFKFMGMRILGQTTFGQIQRLYCLPAIKSFWEEVNAATLTRLQGQPVVLAADGRNDSPGHSAQYLTYTLMDHETHHIVSIQFVDKREVGGKSPNMERRGAEKALQHVLGENLIVAELVTDAHVQIGALLKKEHPDIVHQLDTWHGSKNLSKKLHAVADKKENAELKEWIPAVTNHFWYCSSKAEGEVKEFMGRWRGLLHHVTDKHEWVDGYFSHPACEHQPMDQPTDGKTWLTPGGPAHKALAAVVTDKHLLRSVKYYTRFRHTGTLEIFHQHILMYAAKRFAFSPPVYEARNLLAALDFHLHADRAAKTDDTGNTVFRRMYNKRTKAWFAVKMKEPKTYSYIPDLQRKILEKRSETPGPLSQKAQMSATDPRRIASTLGGNDVPDLSELIQRHVSRLGNSSEMST